MSSRRAQRGLLCVWMAAILAPAALAQRIPKPGFNLFSKEQDIQLGREAAAEMEKKLKLVENREVVEYVERIGRQLAATPEADGYPYTFKVVWDDSINAFALPGGPTYIHTGLIAAAENEGQLAGVMGHEISHVALRHGTNQVSKANFLELGAMIGGSLLGGGSILSQLGQLGIQVGAGSALMKFSRNAERDADILGARMMARIGYNPLEAARFFEKLEAEGGANRGRLAEFFSSHPNPGNRVKTLEGEIQYFPKGEYKADTGQLSRIQGIIRREKPPEAAKPGGQAAQQPESSGRPQTGGQPAPQVGPPVAPSSQSVQFRGRGFTLAHPSNWKAYPAGDGASVTFAPEGGIVAMAGGGSSIVRGAIADIASSNRSQPTDLRRDTEALIQQLRQSNPSMRASNRQGRPVRVGRLTGLLTTLYSDSAIRGETEIDLLLTLPHPQGMLYMVFIAPQKEYAQHQPAFDRMLRSLEVNQ